MSTRSRTVLVAAMGVLLLAAAAGSEPRASGGTDAAHLELLSSGRFPSARACRNCHPNHYEQWSGSQHAYAQLSPVFNAMHGTLVQQTNGTLGDFCIRCHTPVGMQLDEPLFVSNLERAQPSREGVTCAVCHRMRRDYGKVSGRIGLAEGGLEEPISGPTGNAELKRVLGDSGTFRRVRDGDDQLGIHGDVLTFAPIRTSAFCGTCHDVTSPTGVRLEEAFSEYRHSPAAAEGIRCQDCHMSTDPGAPSGFAQGPAAIVGGRPTRIRTLTDHRFVGPDYSVVHPGLFPFNERAHDLATMEQWLTFDWKAGWGTDAYEDQADPEATYPDRWRDFGDRYDARDVIEENLERLDKIADARRALLKKGYRLGEPRLVPGTDHLDIHVEVSNGTTGHNVPTGFTAERLVWLHTVLRGADGAVLFESGDLDANGDVRDSHSRYVHNGEVEHDDLLFTLQSRFVLQNLREGERESILTVNHAASPLPFVRPDPIPNFVSGGPAGTRLHKKGIEPGGARDHRYRIPRAVLAKGQPPYQLTVELKAAMVPVNLIGEIMGVGFDYGMSASEVAEGVVAGHQVLWVRERSIGEGDFQ